MVGEWARIQLVASLCSFSSVLSNKTLGFYFEPSFHITHGGWKATHFTKFSLISHINSGSGSNILGLVFFFFSFLKRYGTLCASAYAITQLLGFSFDMNMVVKDPKGRHIPMCSMVTMGVVKCCIDPWSPPCHPTCVLWILKGVMRVWEFF